MKSVIRRAGQCGRFFGVVLPCGLMLVAGAASPADAAGCAFEPQGEGRVAEILDARTFRLADGREVRLTGIEPITAEKAGRTAALVVTRFSRICGVAPGMLPLTGVFCSAW